jgi:formylglycine-generating enzyme required for sulfatase activity
VQTSGLRNGGSEDALTGGQHPNRDTAATEVKVDTSSDTPDTTHTAQEVAPGTLALAPQTYRVPLKPITGAGNAAPNVAAASVGPSHLSPQVGAHLAAPASEMVLIPAGEFELGSAVGPLDDRADEAPQHSVTLPAYYIDKLPVTNRQFYNFVISSGYKPEGKWQAYYEPATADLPVRAVSWNDAGAYAKWAGKRLPTEAEWEKAARGTDARTYPWGEEWSSEILPRSENYYGLVGSPKIASPYGVLAMCGILWQWTASSYAAYPFNPKAGGDKRVLRGGCFSNGRNIVRCANRYAEPPGVALNTFTFRCAKDGP